MHIRNSTKNHFLLYTKLLFQSLEYTGWLLHIIKWSTKCLQRAVIAIYCAKSADYLAYLEQSSSLLDLLDPLFPLCVRFVMTKVVPAGLNPSFWRNMTLHHTSLHSRMSQCFATGGLPGFTPTHCAPES